jgi:hypothetical protein
MCSWPTASRLCPVQTLIVEPEVLFTVANKLDQLADSPSAGVPSVLRRCLTELERGWEGGTAAALARLRLRQLTTLGEPPPALDGIPARERDRLNRERFGCTPPRIDDGLIMGFDPAGDGRLIVAFGDPDTCHNIATYVPGATASLADSASELDRARALREAAGPDTAVIMWLGYDAPDFADAAFERSARAAAEPLRHFQSSLLATHEGPIGQMTVIGHSYGSVVIGVAERDGDLVADDLVALGSPGMGVARASQLRDPSQVWSSTALNDPIRLAVGPLLGTDPWQSEFGGHRFASAPFGHSGYFRRGNPALDTLAHLVRGEPLP